MEEKYEKNSLTYSCLGAEGCEGYLVEYLHIYHLRPRVSMDFQLRIIRLKSFI